MSQKGFTRKLSAILSADVKGYSRLMSQDEIGTIKTLTAHRDLISDFVQQYQGRVVDSPGDNILAEFSSISNAVSCAVDVQQNLGGLTVDVPSVQKMVWRIGVNLGEVVEEDGRIYGDGVNITARIESLAEAGGICVSGTVYDQVKNKLGLEFEYTGEQSVKNIPEPVRVYRILSLPEVAVPEQAVSPDEKAESAHLEKAAIAVLPFDNMSNDPEQEYFSDGMSEEIISRLAMNPMLSVIARNSTFAYKGKPVKVQQIAQELGVRFVVEGSVRKAGNMVRITAQLIDAISGSHLFAKTYDREFKDVFSLQDEIAQQIVTSVLEGGVVAEISRARSIPSENLTAYDALLRGLEYFYQLKREANAKAIEMAERAIELDPDSALAHVLLGAAYHRDFSMDWNKEPQTLERAFKYSKIAISLDDSSSLAHVVLANVYREKGQVDEAIYQAERAISLNPNDAENYFTKGNVLSTFGRWEEAVELMNKAKQMDPNHGVYYKTDLARVYQNLGRYEEALASLKEAQTQDPDYTRTHLGLAGIYRNLGRYEEAIACLKEALVIDPELKEANHELARNYWMAWATTVSQDPFLLDRALEMALKMVTINDSSVDGHFELSVARLYKRQYKKAMIEAEKLIALAPENAIGYALLAEIFSFTGRPAEAIKMLDKAMALNPVGPNWYLITLGTACSSSGHHTDAIETYKSIFDRSPSHQEAIWAHIGLVVLYIELGQEAEAQAEVAELLKLVPNFSVEVWGQRYPMEDQALINRHMAALIKAGLN